MATALAISGCRSLASPTDVRPTPAPTPTPSPVDCDPGQYLDTPFVDVMITRDVVFSQVSDSYGVHVLRMDIYEAVGDMSPRRPVIVWAYGGHFKTGNRRQLSYFATEFAFRGYVTAAIDYRTLRAGGAPLSVAADAAQSDAQAAIRFLRSRAADLSLDPERFAIGGWSAGSITAFKVGYRYEFTGDNTDNPGFPHTVLTVIGLDGIAAWGDMRRNDPPFILFRAGRGSDDNPAALPALVAQANALGIPHEVHVLSRARHQDLIKRPYNQTIVTLAAPFLRRFLACR